jgi:AcrR family transcriptional regulator
MQVNSEELFKRLKAVFRTYGYEGATLSIISDAVGLKRASLYHHFPNGKQAMAQFVLDEIGKWVDENMVKVCESNLPLRQKIALVLDKTNEMYECGNAACLWRVFSLGVSLSLFQPTIEKQVQGLITAFAKLFVEAGEDASIAQKRAIEVIINIQGRLILVNAMNDVSYFSEYLDDLRNELMS